MRRLLLMTVGTVFLSGCYTTMPPYGYDAYGPYGPYGPIDEPIGHYPGSVPYDEAVRLGIIKDDRPRTTSRSTSSRSVSSRPSVSQPSRRSYVSPAPSVTPAPSPAAPVEATPLPRNFLPDRVVYSQKDPQWGKDKLGPTSASMAKEGCVVTSVAMALGNLGFNTNPGDLNMRLTHADSFLDNGWLIWNGVSEVTGGEAKAHYYDTVSDPLIQSCLTRGDYPLVQFYLPNGRSHWAMIVGRDDKGFHMRDPLRTSSTPLVFPRDANAFRALRCIGLSGGVGLSAH